MRPPTPPRGSDNYIDITPSFKKRFFSFFFKNRLIEDVETYPFNYLKNDFEAKAFELQLEDSLNFERIKKSYTRISALEGDPENKTLTYYYFQKIIFTKYAGSIDEELTKILSNCIFDFVYLFRMNLSSNNKNVFKNKSLSKIFNILKNDQRTLTKIFEHTSFDITTYKVNFYFYFASLDVDLKEKFKDRIIFGFDKQIDDVDFNKMPHSTIELFFNDAASTFFEANLSP